MSTNNYTLGPGQCWAKQLDKSREFYSRKHSKVGYLEEEKSQHGCVRWALCKHLTSPCHEFVRGRLRGGHFRKYWTTLIVVIFDKQFLGTLFFRSLVFIFFGGGEERIQKLISTNFLAISGNFELLWFFQFWQKRIWYAIFYFFWGGGTKNSKNCFRPIFSPFHVNSNNIIFFHFWHLCFGTLFFREAGPKIPKIIYDQFSRHFRQFWTPLIFLGGKGLTTQKIVVDQLSPHFSEFWTTFFVGTLSIGMG